MNKRKFNNIASLEKVTTDVIATFLMVQAFNLFLVEDYFWGFLAVVLAFLAVAYREFVAKRKYPPSE